MREIRDLATGLRPDEALRAPVNTDKIVEAEFLVNGVRRFFRDAFPNGGCDHRVWAKSFSGAGAAIVETTRNQVTLQPGTASGGFAQLLSEAAFTAPFRMSVLMSLSQRIASQNTFIEFVSIGADGRPDEQNVIGWLFDGTTPASGIYRVGNDVNNVLASSGVTISSTATAAQFEFELLTDEARFYSQSVDSTSGKNSTHRRTQRLPDPSARYKMRIRIENTAAVTATNLVINHVACEMFNEVPVEITGNMTGAGNAFAFQVWNSNTLTVGGPAARDSTAPGNPLYVATGRNAWPAVVTTGRNVDVSADLLGRPTMLLHSIPDLTWQSVQAITGTTDVAARAAQAAGVRNYVTGVQASNSSATATELQIKDGTTVIWRHWLPAGAGISVDFAVPLRGTAATAVNVASSVAVTSLFVNVQGFSAPV